MARPSIWLTSRVTANRHKAISEGNTTPSVEGAFVMLLAVSYRLFSTFKSDDVMLLSLRGPLVISDGLHNEPPLSSVFGGVFSGCWVVE